MNKLSLIIAFVLITFISISAQTVERKEIQNREIEWSDFVGAVDESSKFDAVTNWVTTYSFPQPTFKDGKVFVKVAVKVYLRLDSWVKPNRKTSRLLEHERGHFKIGKICAKEFKETIDARAFDRTDYAKQISDIYLEIMNKYKEFEKQYDRETDHFKDLAEQDRWNKKLNDLLN